MAVVDGPFRCLFPRPYNRRCSAGFIPISCQQIRRPGQQFYPTYWLHWFAFLPAVLLWMGAVVSTANLDSVPKDRIAFYGHLTKSLPNFTGFSPKEIHYRNATVRTWKNVAIRDHTQRIPSLSELFVIDWSLDLSSRRIYRALMGSSRAPKKTWSNNIWLNFITNWIHWRSVKPNDIGSCLEVLLLVSFSSTGFKGSIKDHTKIRSFILKLHLTKVKYNWVNLNSDSDYVSPSYWFYFFRFKSTAVWLSLI